MKSEGSFRFQRQLHVGVRADDPALVAAEDTCEAITREHSRSFYFATMLLPAPKRRATRVLYAFCRWSDDIVDEPEARLGYSLDGWAARAQANDPNDDHPVLYAWNELRRRYQLPADIIADLLAGMRMDLSQTRYTTFDDLWLYCYRVAATVGLLSMHIVGFREGAAPHAIRLGVALQLTNILRDVGEDARRGRIYLPQDELAAFGLSDDDLVTGRNDDRWKAFMRFQIARTRQLYEEAWPGIALLHRDGRLAVAAAASVYRAILAKIEANDYDNFTRRAHLSSSEKFLMLPGILWRSRAWIRA